LNSMAGCSGTRPNPDSEQPLASSCQSTRKANMQAKSSILVIEDDTGVAGSWKKELQAEGYEVAVAYRGDDGLTTAKQGTFDVVLTELKMPGLFGLDLVGQLRLAKPKLPIILMTAFGTTETAIEAIRLGVYEHVLKPFDMDELLDLVARAAACEDFTSGLLELGPME